MSLTSDGFLILGMFSRSLESIWRITVASGSVSVTVPAGVMEEIVVFVVVVAAVAVVSLIVITAGLAWVLFLSCEL